MKNSKQAQAAAAQFPAQPWWQKYITYLLPALAFLLYANSIGNGYNMDDELVTRKHKLTSKGISAIPKIFSSPYYSDDMGYSYEYRPMVLTSFAIEHQFFGDKPGVSHFFNVLLYALTVLVLFKVLRRLFDSYSYLLPVLVTLLFALHPLHTEVVASIKNRDEILALLGALGCWWFAIRFAEKGKWWNALFATALFLGGILSKMSIVPGLVLIPLSLVFFVPVTVKRLLVLSFLMGAASYAFLPITEPSAYIPIYVAVLLLPCLVLWIRQGRFRESWVKLLADLLRFVQGAKINVAASFSGADAENTPSLALHPVRFQRSELFQVAFLVSVLLLVAGAVTYTLNLQEYLLLGWFLVFGGVYYVSNHSQRNVLIVLFTLMFQWVCYRSYQPIYVDFGVFFLAVVFLLNARYRSVLLLAAILSFVPLYLYFGRIPDLLVTCLAFTVLVLRHKNRFFRIAATLTLLVNAAVLVSTLVMLALGRSEFNSEIIILSLNSIILLTLNKTTQKFILPLLLFVCIPFLFLLHDGYRDLSPEKPAVETVVQEAKPTGENQLPSTLVDSDRPISFAEVPVTQSSPLDVRVASALEVMGFYLQKMLFPYPLGYYYGYAYFKPSSLTEPLPLVFLCIHLALLVAVFWGWRRQKVAVFSLLFYLLAIALFSGLAYPVVGVVGERFAYFASIGWCVFLAFALIRFLQGMAAIHKTMPPNNAILGVVLLIGLVQGFITLTRNSDWKNAITLMGNDIDHLDESAQAHNLYALNLMRESYEGKGYTPQQQFNMRKMALGQFERALEIWPDFFNAAYDKGRVGTLVGDFPKAIEGYEAAIRIGPEPGFMEPYYQLTELYLKTARYPEYLLNARRIFYLDRQTHPEAYNLMAKGFYLNGNADSAKTYLRLGMQVYPADQSLRKNMAEIFKNQGIADSVAYYNTPQ